MWCGLICVLFSFIFLFLVVIVLRWASSGRAFLRRFSFHNNFIFTCDVISAIWRNSTLMVEHINWASMIHHSGTSYHNTGLLLLMSSCA